MHVRRERVDFSFVSRLLYCISYDAYTRRSSYESSSCVTTFVLVEPVSLETTTSMLLFFFSIFKILCVNNIFLLTRFLLRTLRFQGTANVEYIDERKNLEECGPNVKNEDRSIHRFISECIYFRNGPRVGI